MDFCRQESDYSCYLTSLLGLWAILDHPVHSSIHTSYRQGQISLCCIWWPLPAPVNLFWSSGNCVLLQRLQPLLRNRKNFVWALIHCHLDTVRSRFSKSSYNVFYYKCPKYLFSNVLNGFYFKMSSLLIESYILERNICCFFLCFFAHRVLAWCNRTTIKKDTPLLNNKTFHMKLHFKVILHRLQTKLKSLLVPAQFSCE